VRDRVRTFAEKGITLEQIQSARPTYEYDPLLRRRKRDLDHPDVRRGPSTRE